MAVQKRLRTVNGDCALVQIVTSSPVFHSTIATWVSSGTCWTEGLVYSRSTIQCAAAKPASTSPLRILVTFATLVPGCGLKAAST